MIEPERTRHAGRDADPAGAEDRAAPWYFGPVPQLHRTARYLFVPLTTELVAEDYTAVMATAEHLRRWSDSSWPTDDFTIAENHHDLVWHDEEHRERVAFTYSVLDAQAAAEHRRRVVGCVYIRPFSTACSTRGVVCPPDLLASGDAVVRGWLIDELSAQRREFAHLVLSWMESDSWRLPAAWWQERSGEVEVTTGLDSDHRIVAPWLFSRRRSVR